MKAIHGGKAKNDKIDSQKIAQLLRGGMLPQAYVVVTSLFPSSIRTCGVERLVVSCDSRFPILRTQKWRVPGLQSGNTPRKHLKNKGSCVC